MNDTAQVSFRCEGCGAVVEWPEHAVDTTPTFCNNCGAHHGTYSDLRKQAETDALAAIEAILSGKRSV